MKRPASSWAARLRRVGTGLLLQAVSLGATAAAVETQTRSVADFDEVVFAVAGELQIEQGPREALSVSAEPAVLRMITTQVHERRLLIGLAPGRVETQAPIRFKLDVRALRGFESRTAGTVRIGPLRSDALTLALAGGGSIRVAQLAARNLEVRISGAGEVALDGGQVAAQRIAIAGIGNYAAPALASERAEVAIEGNGTVRLAASAVLAVRISGVGQVRYRGEPALTRDIRGIGTIEKD